MITDHEKFNKYVESINEYVNRMSDKDKENLSLGAVGDYAKIGKGKMEGAVILKKIGDKPVSMFEISKEGPYAGVSVYTDPKHYGKGYATEVSKIGMKYVEQHMQDVVSVTWLVAERNKASIRIAKKLGFDAGEYSGVIFSGGSLKKPIKAKYYTKDIKKKVKNQNGKRTDNH